MADISKINIKNAQYDVKDNVAREHIKDTDNPHHVTAEQVGARSDTWMPSASDVGARPATWMPTAADVHARPESWTPSASDVGALPISGGTMSGSINMNNNFINNLGAPTDNAQAANKGYVDGAVRKAAPRNLMDNSDFTNLIAQAGIGGKHGTVTYAADRWILDSGTVSYTAGVGLTLNGTILQKLEFLPTGETSAFVGTASGDASISYADGAVTITSSGGVIAWAALYSGAYTDATKPEYRYKGYAMELAECQRYYRRFADSYMALSGYVTSSTTSIQLNTPYAVKMRITPTVTFIGTLVARGISGYVESNAGYQNPTAYLISGSFYTLAFAKSDSSAWSNVTNNTPVSVSLKDFVLEFNADL